MSEELDAPVREPPRLRFTAESAVAPCNARASLLVLPGRKSTTTCPLRRILGQRESSGAGRKLPIIASGFEMPSVHIACLSCTGAIGFPFEKPSRRPLKSWLFHQPDRPAAGISGLHACEGRGASRSGRLGRENPRLRCYAELVTLRPGVVVAAYGQILPRLSSHCRHLTHQHPCLSSATPPRRFADSCRNPGGR